MTSEISSFPLLELPPELIAMIVENVLPDDLDKFAASCKSIRQLAKERQLRLRYYNTILSYVNYDDHPTPADLLTAMVYDPRICSYVKKLNVLACVCVKDYIEKYYQATIELKKPLGAALVHLVENSKYLSRKQRLSWSKDILEGYDGPSVGLCLMLLPNLTSIRLRNMCTFRYIQTVIDSIAHMNQDSTEPQALSKLVKMKIECGEGYCPDFNMLTSIAALPSMRDLRFESPLWSSDLVRDDNTSQNDAILPPNETRIIPTSNLRKLSLNTADTSILQILNLCSMIKGLQEFAWINCYKEAFPANAPPQYPEKRLDIPRICKVLSEYAQETLITLRLYSDCPYSPDYSLGGFSVFKTLKHVHLYIWMIANVIGDGRTLTGILPRSIESLSLRFIDKPSEIKKLFRSLDVNQFSNLKRVCLYSVRQQRKDFGLIMLTHAGLTINGSPQMDEQDLCCPSQKPSIELSKNIARDSPVDYGNNAASTHCKYGKALLVNHGDGKESISPCSSDFLIICREPFDDFDRDEFNQAYQPYEDKGYDDPIYYNVTQHAAREKKPRKKGCTQRRDRSPIILRSSLRVQP